MYLEGEDFQTVWQLAHNWTNADPDTSDPSALPPELMQAIHRLLSAIMIRGIVACTKKISVLDNDSIRIAILDDESIGTVIFDSIHCVKINRCLRKNRFDKGYLNSIYVKRSEVLDWCDKERIAPPALWATENSSAEQATSKTTPKNRPKHEDTDRLLCQAVALTLWALDPNIHPAHMARSKILRRIGNGRHYNQDTIKKWVGEIDALKDQRGFGRPPDIPYKIDLEIDPQLKE